MIKNSFGLKYALIATFLLVPFLLKAEINSDKDYSFLPPVRRLGINLTESNLDAFRRVIGNTSVLRGLPHDPINEDTLDLKITEKLQSILRQTGRFWTISLNSELGFVNNTTGVKEIALVREKTVKDYSLDAWLTTSLFFSPDGTTLRLVVSDPKNSKNIYVKEDIIMPPQASLEDVTESLYQGIDRVISSLAQDGSVIDAYNDLVTINFGKERGLQRGDILNAGYVIAMNRHPKTGEYLSSKRIPTKTIKVIKVDENSALCQIIEEKYINENRYCIQKAIKENVPLLVWRLPKKVDSNEGWHRPYDPYVEPIVGFANKGFNDDSRDNNKNNEAMAKSAHNHIDAKKEQDAHTKDKEVQNQEHHSKEKAPEGEHLKGINILNLKGLLGVSIARFQPKNASLERINLPPYLVNNFGISSEIEIYTKFNFEPSAKVTYSNTNSNFLASTFISLPLRYVMDQSSLYKFELGTSLFMFIGAIDFNESNGTLNNFAINIDAKYTGNFMNLVKYQTRLAISPVDWLRGDMLTYAQVSASLPRNKYIPHQLSMGLYYHKASSQFNEYGLFFQWDFLPYIVTVNRLGE